MPVSNTHETPMFSIRAAIRPDTVSVEGRTAELIWTTGAKGRRYSWDIGSYNEELDVSDKAVRMERLNNGAPLLAAHRSYGLESVLGVVERAWIENGEGHALVRFSQRDDADAVFRDVKDGILRNISVGYAVHRYDIVESADEKIPTYRATDWEPMELSIVPIGFDDGAKVRSAGEPDDYAGPRFTTEFTTRAAGDQPTESPAAVANQPVGEPEMTEEEKRAAEQQRQAELKDQVEAERKRGITIRAMARKIGIDEKVADDLVERGVTVEAASAALIDAIAERDGNLPETRGAQVTVVEDIAVATEIRNAAMEAITARAVPGSKLSTEAQRFGGMSLLRLSEELLTLRGVNCRGMSPEQIAVRALSTSDLPSILANVMNKTLRAGYESAQRTFVGVFRQASAADFKQIQRTQLSGAPSLEEVTENGEFKYGKVTDAKEVYALKTYGKILPFTRQTIINDDMDALSRIPGLFGRAAADLESDTVWGLVQANPTMADGGALFNSTAVTTAGGHANLAGAGAAITVASVGAARAAMRKQVGLEGRLINVMGRHFVVGADKEVELAQFLGGIVPAKSSDVVPEMLRSYNPVVEPRLTGNAWYLFADYNQIDTVEYCYLEGNAGVYIETRQGFGVDGVEIKARHDFAAKAIDWRGMYKNPGA